MRGSSWGEQMKQAKGNKKAAADLLGLQRTTLVEKLRRRQREVAAAAPAAAPPVTTPNH